MITKLGKADSFMLFGKNGMMQQNERVHISRGTRIIGLGYACNRQDFVVYDDNMNCVEICTGDPEEISEYDLGRYYSPIHTLDETTRPISQQFGIGFYYDESDEVISDEVIEKSLRRAENIAKLEKETKERKEREAEETEKRLLKEYSYLERAEKYDHKVCGRNIRTELKRNFPDTKFSVKYSSFSGGNDYCVSWENGPTTDAVSNIVDKYGNRHPDAYSMGDYWDCVPSIFNNLYGSVGYITTNRHYSADVTEKVQKLFPDLTAENYKNYPFEDNSLHSYIYQHNVGFEEFLRHLAHYVDLTEKKEAAPKTEKVAGDFRIIDYSEKAIAVVGDTKAIKDELKKLGGKFNPRLSCGAGWIFSAKKRAAVEKLLS